ncbi:hypothetical protein QE430_001069 [Microbacterium testaceum]|uniref:hypothetical protein n=1 Tax=Microbacterium TaxID=33882 RepID=UPI002782398C|nr:hypothetical protein [Microbacterium testaceum]MDQ1172762.1 hypothetical protein [Microbacterium testaceum]
MNTTRRRALLGIAAAATAVTVAAPAQRASAADPADVVTKQQVHGVRNVLEFGDSSMTDEARLRLALSSFVSSREEVRLTISRRMVITDTITVDTSYVSLDFTQGTVDARGVKNKPAFVFTGSSNAGYPNTRCTVTGLRILGPGSAATTAPGVVFEGTSTTDVRGVGIFGMELSGFATGIEFRSNAFLLSFFNCHVYRCNVGISMPGGLRNYGENIKFIGGGIGTCDLAVQNSNPDGNFHLISTSIDFCRRAVEALAGGVFIDAPHIEFNETGARSTDAHFVTGSDSSAKIILTSGHIFFHEDPVAPAIFETRNPSWGGGIHLISTALMRTSTTSGFLCGGTGQITISDPVVYDGGASGSSMGALMPSPQANVLVDGSFEQSTVVEAYVNNTDRTSRTANPGISLRVASGNLVVKRLSTTKPGTVAFDVPVAFGKLYAMAITFGSTTSTGSLELIESFVALRGETTAGVPNVLRNQARGATSIPLKTIAGTANYRRVFGAGTWDRRAPAWATHFRLRLLFDKTGLGETQIQEIVITAL